MITKKTLLLGLLASMSLTLTACQDASDSRGNPSSGMSPIAVPIDADYVPGLVASTYSVKSHSAAADSGASTDAELAIIFAEFQSLGRLTADLYGVNRIVYTEAGNYELYDGAALVAAFKPNGSVLELIWGREGFLIDSASFSLIAEAQKAPRGDMTFKLRQCIVQEQEQEQGKEKGKNIPDKCEGITVVIVFEGEIPKQEQEQDQKEPTPTPAPTPTPVPSPTPAPTPEPKK